MAHSPAVGGGLHTSARDEVNELNRDSRGTSHTGQESHLTGTVKLKPVHTHTGLFCLVRHSPHWQGKAAYKENAVLSFQSQEGVPISQQRQGSTVKEKLNEPKLVAPLSLFFIIFGDTKSNLFQGSGVAQLAGTGPLTSQGNWLSMKKEHFVAVLCLF